MNRHHTRLEKPTVGSSAEPSFALALGGGGARGLAHIHAIEAMNELGITPAVIAGSSIGAIMGAGMASGMSGREIREFAMSTLGDGTNVASLMWKLRPASLGDMLSRGFRFGQLDIERTIRAFLPERIPQCFEELEIALKIVATDFYGQTEAVLESGELGSAIAASAALPAIFRPVRRNNRILIDGGIYNPVPFDIIEKDAEIVIAIDVIGGPEGNVGMVPGPIDAVFGASQLMMQSIIETRLRAHRPAIYIRPPVSKFRVLDFMKISAILSETSGIKDELKRAVDAAIAFHQSR